MEVLETTHKPPLDDQVTTCCLVLLAAALVEKSNPQMPRMLAVLVGEDLVFVLIPPQQEELQMAVPQLLLAPLGLGMAALAVAQEAHQQMVAQEATVPAAAAAVVAAARRQETAAQAAQAAAAMSSSSQCKENQ
jgi:hypothetical protein